MPATDPGFLLGWGEGGEWGGGGVQNAFESRKKVGPSSLEFFEQKGVRAPSLNPPHTKPHQDKINAAKCLT